jgi:hypothetical protein
MAAPKQNQFWKLRSKHGRDKLFATPELLWEAACEYFQWCDDNPIEAEDNKGTKNVNTVKFNRPYTVKGLCLFLNTCETWFKEFKKRELSDDFITVCRKIEDTIYTQKFEGAICGFYNANIIARDLGLHENVNQKVEGAITINPKQWVE